MLVIESEPFTANDCVNAAGALDFDFFKPRDRPLAINAWFVLSEQVAFSSFA